MVALVIERGPRCPTTVLGHAQDNRPWYKILDEVGELEAGISWSGSEWLRHESFWARVNAIDGSVARRIRAPRKTELTSSKDAIRWSLWNKTWGLEAPQRPNRVAFLNRESDSSGRIMIRPLEEVPPRGSTFLHLDSRKVPLRDIEVILWKLAN